MDLLNEEKRWQSPGIPTFRFLLDFYDACLREKSPQKVAMALGLSKKEIYSMMRKSPMLQQAQKLAEERRGNNETFRSYVFNTLSKEGREMWERIKFFDNADSDGDRLEKLFKNQTIALRQELFIFALTSSNFDTSEACRKVGVNRQMLRDWMKDIEFKELLEEIEFHKKNFFEKGLVTLVEAGHPGAVMFANRTKNADRGYSEKVQVEHSGRMEQVLDLDTLELDVDTKRKLLDAMRKQKEKLLLPVTGEVIDVEPVKELSA